MTPDRKHLELPFFDAAHRSLGRDVAAWAEKAVTTIDESDDRAACRQWVRALGDGGWLRYCVPAAFGGALPALDSRSLVVLRETLAFHSPLADFAFAMQGLGSGAITLAGSEAQRQRYLPAVARGDTIAAFALSEPGAGSDVAALATRAERTADGWRLHGEKTWISNGGIADFYCLFAKTEVDAGSRGISAFIVDAGTPGLDDRHALAVMSPHPLATLTLRECLVPAHALLGSQGAGFKLAMQTLDIFRASVAGAALGFARRALAESVQHARSRRMFGGHLADFQLTQAKVGQMAADIDAGALLTYRAAWMRDDAVRRNADVRISSEPAMAKMVATENAQHVIDAALQMHGGLGVMVGSRVEALYRDIRALRIYEGATEVQQLIIGRHALATAVPRADAGE
ncbi:MAG: acyl-CoA dehydrogenase family protein [Proteobacteria bacterium]|nr:acyl-CoA dehydrogenase family protein [Pseudomonadota bacterium]